MITINNPESRKLANEILAGLKEAGEVKVTGLGFFRVKTTNERQGKNPRTGEVITIPSRKKIAFKVSKTLKDAIVSYNNSNGSQSNTGGETEAGA